MPSLATIERRLSRLESAREQEQEEDAGDESVPWYVRYFDSLLALHERDPDAISEKEINEELDYLVPCKFEHIINGGTPGYPTKNPGGVFREHDPAFEKVWCQWANRYHHAMHEESMGRLKPCGSHELYDFWTVRTDPTQEQLRQELVSRMLAVCREHEIGGGLIELLTDWRPSSPQKCTTMYSSERFKKWWERNNPWRRKREE